MSTKYFTIDSSEIKIYSTVKWTKEELQDHLNKFLNDNIVYHTGSIKVGEESVDPIKDFARSLAEEWYNK